MQQVPITSNGLSLLLLLGLGPHVYEQQKGDHDRTMEVLKGYLEKVNRLRPLRPNPSWWTQLLEQCIVVSQTYREKEGYYLKPASLSKLKKLDEKLYDDVVKGLANASPPATTSAVD